MFNQSKGVVPLIIAGAAIGAGITLAQMGIGLLLKAADRTAEFVGGQVEKLTKKDEAKS